MSKSSMDVTGRKQWSTPALERLDLSGTRSGAVPASAEVSFPGTSQHPSTFQVAHPHS